MNKLMVVAGAAMMGFTSVAQPVNVLTLGVKNDGSEDISAIVNAASEKSALFFPAGQYKVEKPLVIKHSIHGEGYSRGGHKLALDNERTWFISALNAVTNVVSIEGRGVVNVEEINFKCTGEENVIAANNIRQDPYVFISKVGIYNLRGIGISVRGYGSRSVFMQDLTIWGDKGHPMNSMGIFIGEVADCRVTNVEVMGARIGMRIENGYTYGCNLHLWTGSMSGTDNGVWWEGTRGLVLGNGAHFAGANIYPDTSFYAIQQEGTHGTCEISNIMYWEDGSIKVAKNHNAEFYHKDPGSTARLLLNGGLVGIAGNDQKPGWMGKVYMPEIQVYNVALKSNYEIKGSNIDRLCLGGELPDYVVEYKDVGWCKVADIFTVAPTGSCEAELSLEDGAAWQFSVLKDKSGKVASSFKPLNSLCDGWQLKTKEGDGVLRVYLNSPTAEPLRMRFKTQRMGTRFRPVHHGCLYPTWGPARYREVLKEL